MSRCASRCKTLNRALLHFSPPTRKQSSSRSSKSGERTGSGLGDDGAEDLGHPIKAILNLRNQVQLRTVDLGSVPSLKERRSLCGGAVFSLLTFVPEDAGFEVLSAHQRLRSLVHI